MTEPSSSLFGEIISAKDIIIQSAQGYVDSTIRAAQGLVTSSEALEAVEAVGRSAGIIGAGVAVVIAGLDEGVQGVLKELPSAAVAFEGAEYGAAFGVGFGSAFPIVGARAGGGYIGTVLRRGNNGCAVSARRRARGSTYWSPRARRAFRMFELEYRQKIAI